MHNTVYKFTLYAIYSDSQKKTRKVMSLQAAINMSVGVCYRFSLGTYTFSVSLALVLTAHKSCLSSQLYCLNKYCSYNYNINPSVLLSFLLEYPSIYGPISKHACISLTICIMLEYPIVVKTTCTKRCTNIH